ncbi:MAG: hypothetical protein V3U78_08910 [Thiotrichaceae bacterium]
MIKFALYYGVTRDGDKLETLALGNKGEVQSYKIQCKKDMNNPKIANKYSCLVLATDYGLVNRYKLNKIAAAPKVAKKTTKKEEK